MPLSLHRQTRAHTRAHTVSLYLARQPELFFFISLFVHRGRRDGLGLRVRPAAHQRTLRMSIGAYMRALLPYAHTHTYSLSLCACLSLGIGNTAFTGAADCADVLEQGASRGLERRRTPLLPPRREHLPT
jgi:hypothetical protein